MDIQCVPASILGIITIIAVLCLIFRWFGLKKVRSFYVWVGVLAVLGGAWAFLFPLAINADFSQNGDGAALRQMLIYTTGGVLGVITFYIPLTQRNLPYLYKGEPYDMAEKTKKAQIFKRDNTWWSKNWFYTILIAVAVIGGVCAFLVVPFAVPQPFSKDDSISTLRQAVLVATGGFLAILTLWENRRKNDQEHMRQVHAERRARYAKAIEQLADEKAPIRLGGVYTLVKLVDEWLADEKTLPIEKERQEEGQVIINNLCAYIRSPFDLASKTEVLSQNETPENYEGGNQQFIKDQARFREEKELRLTILEAVRNRLHKGTRIHKNGTQKILPGQWSDFDYDFSNTVFFYPVDFSKSYFGAPSNFSGARFTDYAGFNGAEFTDYAGFNGAEFTGGAAFAEARFTDYAGFNGAEFTGGAAFAEARFTRGADFFRATFTDYAGFNGAEFTGGADFAEARFTRGANFSEATFTEGANFFGAKFADDADFSEATFSQNHFFGARFTGGANFSEATFKEKPIFEYAPGSKTYRARFSHKADPKIYNFEVSPNSPYKVETEEQELNGVTLRIPKGAILFDPDDPSEQKYEDDGYRVNYIFSKMIG